MKFHQWFWTRDKLVISERNEHGEGSSRAESDESLLQLPPKTDMLAFISRNTLLLV